MNKIPNIYYHSVAPAPSPGWYRSFLTMPLSYFEAFIRHLCRRNYRFLTLDEYFACRQNGRQSKSRLVCLTFDDGYLDNYVFAYPVMKKHGAKATVFINPEFVQESRRPRPTLADVWEGNAVLADLPTLGFASWEELRVMQASGVMDIQSHTMTHTKYFVSDKIIDFHHPCSDYLYPIANRHPEAKAHYMTDPDFIRRIPWGTPFFEEQSSLIARKIAINEQFNEECVAALKTTDWRYYSFSKCLEKIAAIYKDYKLADKLINHVETDKEYESRVRSELRDSKRIIEERLKKQVRHCCWPHGKYSEFTHRIAREVGYASSLIVLGRYQENIQPDRFDRIGGGPFGWGRRLSLRKAVYKLNAYRNVFPYDLVRRIWDRLHEPRKG